MVWYGHCTFRGGLLGSPRRLLHQPLPRLLEADGFGGRVWLGDPDTSKHTITARRALAALCWAADKRSGYHNPAGPKPCRKLIHASHIFPTPYVVFHCLRRRPFQISELPSWQGSACFITSSFVCFRSSRSAWVLDPREGLWVRSWTNGALRSHMDSWL